MWRLGGLVEILILYFFMINYVSTIKTAIFVFPLIAIFFTLPFILQQYHQYGSINKFRVLVIYSFILYMITIYFLVILPLPKREDVSFEVTQMIRVVPFTFIKDIIRETSFVITEPSTYFHLLTDHCCYVVYFNILMTVPFGIYLRYYFRCSFKKTLVFTFLLSLFFELTQLSGLYFIYDSPYRLFDVDDLILNTLGGVLGYFLFSFFKKYLPTREEIDEETLKDGMVVSGFRRVVVFLLDFLLCFFFVVLFSFFFHHKIVKYVIFLIYYLVIPAFLGSRTLGSKFLNVRFEVDNHKLLRLGGRIIFLYLYYFVVPGVFLSLILGFVGNLEVEVFVKLFLLLLVFFLFFLFYLIHFLYIIFGKVYYDVFFQIKYVSTIKRE